MPKQGTRLGERTKQILTPRLSKNIFQSAFLSMSILFDKDLCEISLGIAHWLGETSVFSFSFYSISFCLKRVQRNMPIILPVSWTSNFVKRKILKVQQCIEKSCPPELRLIFLALFWIPCCCLKREQTGFSKTHWSETEHISFYGKHFKLQKRGLWMRFLSLVFHSGLVCSLDEPKELTQIKTNNISCKNWRIIMMMWL